MRPSGTVGSRRPSSAVVRGPAPSATAARRSASVSTSRTGPASRPRAATAPPARCGGGRARAEARAAAATPTRRQQRRPGAVRRRRRRRAGRGRGRRSAAASSAGRSAGRSEDSAATAGPRRVAGAVLERRVQPAVGLVGDRAGAQPADDGGGRRVVGDHDAPRPTAGQASAAATVSASRASTRSSCAVARSPSRRSAAAAASWRRRAASPGRRPTSCARTHVSTRRAGTPGARTGRRPRVDHGQDHTRGPRRQCAEGGPWPRRPQAAATGPAAAREVAHARPADLRHVGGDRASSTRSPR